MISGVFYYWDKTIYSNLNRIMITQGKDKSEFVERFPEFSLFYRLFSPLDSEMICIVPYFYPCEESAREIREIFI